MDYRKSIEPVTALKTNPAELIDRATETGQPIIITQRGRATAVLQDIQTFQRQQETLLMLKLVAQGAEEIRGGQGIPQDVVRDRVRRRLESLDRG